MLTVLACFGGLLFIVSGVVFVASLFWFWFGAVAGLVWFVSAVPSVGWCVGLVWFIDCGAALSVAWITGYRLVLVLLPIVRFCVWCLGCFDVLILGFVGCWFCRVRV